MQRNTNTTDSAIRDVLFSPRGVKRQRRDTLTHATHATTTTIQTQTDPESIIEETEQEQEQETCAICMDVTSKTKNVSVTECGHRFCTSCLLKSLQTKNTCPMCRAEIEPARKPNLEQLTANIAADLIQAEERDIDIHRRIAVIGAFSDPRGRSDMILSLCREFAFGTAHSIAGWQGTDDQTYHASWIDYEYNNYEDDDDETEDGDDDEDEDEDASDDGSVHHVNENGDGVWRIRGEWRRIDGNDNDDNGNDDNGNGNDDAVDTEKRDEVNPPPPSWDEVFPKNATESTSQSASQSTMTQSTTTTTQTSSIRALMHNLISGVVSYTLFYTFYYTLPNLVSSLVDKVVQNIRQE
jgi:hypothetical protein